jgi:hypothetical protein
MPPKDVKNTRQNQWDLTEQLMEPFATGQTMSTQHDECIGWRMHRITNSHWFCAIFLLPAVLMIAAHEVFGLSDAMGGIQVGERPPFKSELVYNYAMVNLFYAGVIGYLAHAFKLAPQGWHWLVAKLLLLAAAWYALLAYGH